jgi:polysaccharide pyruvyl transferase WcaK-like protein
MNIVLYPHGGSGNHGCEAIVRTTNAILRKTIPIDTLQLASYNKQQDIIHGVENIDEFINFESIQTKSIVNISGAIYSRIFKKPSLRNKKHVKDIINNIRKDNIYVSIGGDIYSYKGVVPYDVLTINKKVHSSGNKLILWGCSIGEDCLTSSIIPDLNKYDLIIARESITYQSLLSKKIGKNVKLYPDPAFILSTQLPDDKREFDIGNIIGINISPLIIEKEQNVGIALKNYDALIQHIIDTTDAKIALIPHVVWEINDDRKLLKQLYNQFKNTGRIILIEDQNCMCLKWYISQCKIFIGARTHATIASYSTCVPTLVVGYSVKAKGIAKDLFGTYENYVIPVQSLRCSDDLIKAYEWVNNNYEKIKKHLSMIMPNYIQKAWNAGTEIKKLI